LSDDEEDCNYLVSCYSDKQWRRLDALKDKDLSRGVFLHVEGPRRYWCSSSKLGYSVLVMVTACHYSLLCSKQLKRLEDGLLCT